MLPGACGVLRASGTDVFQSLGPAGEAVASDSERSRGRASPGGSAGRKSECWPLPSVAPPDAWTVVVTVCSDEPCLHHPGSSGVYLLFFKGGIQEDFIRGKAVASLKE